MRPTSADLDPSTDGTDLVPTLVHAFRDRRSGASERRRIPRDGLILGLGTNVFAEAFADGGMSARHAEIRLEGGRAFVRDLSGGDTRLNGNALVGEHNLEPGDVLRMGDTLVVYAPAPAVTLAEPASELIGDGASLVAV